MGDRTRWPVVDPIGGLLERGEGLPVSSGTQEGESPLRLAPDTLIGLLLGEVEDRPPVDARAGAEGRDPDLIERGFLTSGRVLGEHLGAEPLVSVRLAGLDLEDGDPIPG